MIVNLKIDSNYTSRK